MSACKIAKLTDRSVIRVAGADARKFLQGLVTSDMDRVKDGAAIHAALLTPQGKILFDFFIVEAVGGFLLDCQGSQAGDLIKRLTFYKLRAAVDIVDLSCEHDVWAAWDGAPKTASAIVAFTDPRLPALGTRLVLPCDVSAKQTGCAEASEADYHAHRIALGVPEGGRDFVYGDAFPHEADFDQLGGVDFKKGCFVGQEVVSRMQHRGTARKRVVPVEGSARLTEGAAITAGDDTPLGEIGSVTDALGLALVRLDRAEAAMAKGKPLQACGVSVRLLQPDWASFKVPGGSNT